MYILFFKITAFTHAISWVFFILTSNKCSDFAGIYFSVCMVIVCLSCVFAVWVLFLHFRGDSRPVPSWAKNLFLKKLRFVLCDTSRVGNLEQGAMSEDDKVLAFIYM